MSDTRMLQLQNRLRTADVQIAAADDTDTFGDAILVSTADHRLWIQRITLSITTHAAGAKITIQDDAASPVPIASHTDAAAAAGVLSVVHWEFGEVGTPLTTGKNLDVIINTPGMAGRLHIEGYERLANAVAAGRTNV